VNAGAPRAPVAVGEFALAPRASRVLVFGGTFDPPHRAHIELPEAARAALNFGAVLYVPAARSPHKSSGPRASDADRVDMLRAALAGRGSVASISTFEIDAARAAGSDAAPSYTIDTLRALARAHPGATLRLLIGADQAAAFHRWREPNEIITLAEPVVMLRAPAEHADALLASMSPHWPAAELERWRTRIVAVPLVLADATSLRAALAKRAHTPGAHEPIHRELLHPDVLRLIDERGLYRDAPRA
jgi:nicotinate-nucleotide adenylyltransferase